MSNYYFVLNLNILSKKYRVTVKKHKNCTEASVIFQYPAERIVTSFLYLKPFWNGELGGVGPKTSCSLPFVLTTALI